MFKLSPIILFMFAALVVLTNQSAVNGATLKCEYDEYITMGEIVYCCDVINNGIFTDARVRINAVEGRHIPGYTNKNVTGLDFRSIPSLKFFPFNLENNFGDLITIEIRNCNLKEIKQEDLKVFPMLQHLNLAENKITTLDANLFEFNPKLVQINLYRNQISHIDPHVFDHLNNLIYLTLGKNKCKNALGYARDSRSELLKLTERVRNGDCTNVDVLENMKKAQEKTSGKMNSAIDGLKMSNGGCRLSFFMGNFLIFFITLFDAIKNIIS